MDIFFGVTAILSLIITATYIYEISCPITPEIADAWIRKENQKRKLKNEQPILDDMDRDGVRDVDRTSSVPKVLHE
jgi:hypothetical protein